MKTLSDYRECQNCKHRFKLSPTIKKYEHINLNKFNKSVIIFCPRCQSTSIAIISKIQYEVK